MTERERLLRRLNRNLALALNTEIPGPTRRRHARHAAYFGERLGIIVRKMACEHCNVVAPLQRHHTDYSRPLAITYLCAACHARADQENLPGHIDSDGDRAA